MTKIKHHFHLATSRVGYCALAVSEFGQCYGQKHETQRATQHMAHSQEDSRRRGLLESESTTSLQSSQPRVGFSFVVVGGIQVGK